MSVDTIELAAFLATHQHPDLADVLARPGTRTVLLAGSKDPNAKATLVLLDEYGPAFVVKIPTTKVAQKVVRNEGFVLEALAGLRLGPLSLSLPRALGYMSVDGLTALVSTAVTGTPMTVSYHGWRHTARRRHVHRDFAAAGAWLADLQTRTAGHRVPITLLSDTMSTVMNRFRRHPGLPTVRKELTAAAARLARHTTPRTVVHGDYWFGNLLLDADRSRVIGVVDWESGVLDGEPLRDVARFAASYALYLDRHTRHGHRVIGHRGLRADHWGAGLAYVLRDESWFAGIVKGYLGGALARLGVPAERWRDVLLAGIAEVAATADHPGFAHEHLELLVRVLGGQPDSSRTGLLVPGPADDDTDPTGPDAEVQA